MKLKNYTYKNQKSLESFIEKEIFDDAGILVQIFSGTTSQEILTPILQTIKQKLPNANIIGASTASEIFDGKRQSDTIVISFSIFEKTEVQSYYFEDVDFQSGIDIAKIIIKKDTKACIVFCEALSSDSESFLNGFTFFDKNIVVAGGNAGDNYSFTKTIVIQDDKIHNKGVVIATLTSKDLIAFSNYSLEWTPLGKEMVVTKCDTNIIYEIDNISIKNIYAKYLGREVLENIPASIISFPLVKVDDGILVARATIAELEDGFVYAGHFKVGDRVRFAIGNVDEILKNASKLKDKIIKNPIEATYVYSCSVRNMFLKDRLNFELSMINKIAPSVGFFTYGEFFHSGTKNQLLNITTTTLSLSEDSTNYAKMDIYDYNSHEDLLLKPLTNLVNATQNELSDIIRLHEQYKDAMDLSSIVSKTDSKGVITYVNSEFCKASGYTKEELIGKNHNIVRHPDNPSYIFEDLWNTIRQGKVWKGIIKNRTKNGGDYYVKSVISPILDENGETVEYIAIRTDITELVKKDEIIELQYTDDLTSLKNKEAMFDILKKSNEEVVLFLINIDRFSLINDYYGYETGNKILKDLALFLKEEIFHKDVYRISGDEFGVLCIEKEDITKIKEHILEHIHNMKEKSFVIEKTDIKLDYSCGVAKALPDEVYKLAHMALKECSLRKEKVVFYNENDKLGLKAKYNIEMVHKIRLAIQEDRVVPYFQGIYDHQLQKITKYETLMRVIEPDGNVLTPFFFLEHAKGAKLYDQLTRIMIKKSFKAFEERDCEFSINLTMKDISSNETKDLLFHCMYEYNCQDRVVLEIVESEGIENFEEINEFICEAKNNGFKIAVDDFGTGYSNFSYLISLKVDYLKIDGSIIKNIITDKNSQIVLQSILFFARNMHLKTIAEFVENKEIYEMLKDWGVDYSQGYYFSKPTAVISE